MGDGTDGDVLGDLSAGVSDSWRLDGLLDTTTTRRQRVSNADSRVIPNLYLPPTMPPRGNEALDFTPILTHYLFLFTSILSVVR